MQLSKVNKLKKDKKKECKQNSKQKLKILERN